MDHARKRRMVHDIIVDDTLDALAPTLYDLEAIVADLDEAGFDWSAGEDELDTPLVMRVAEERTKGL